MSVSVPQREWYTDSSRASKSSAECMAIYDTWAATYNDEVTSDDQGYDAPLIAAQVAASVSDNFVPSVILDAGCGTGLVGQALAICGAKVIDGIDLSNPMLKLARHTGVYRHLTQVDMNKPIQSNSEVCDIVTCVGTFTLGHVGPKPALRELVRLSKTNGIVVATILEDLWLNAGFREETETMAEEGTVAVVSDQPIDYVRRHNDKAVLLVLRKNAVACIEKE